VLRGSSKGNARGYNLFRRPPQDSLQTNANFPIFLGSFLKLFAPTDLIKSPNLKTVSALSAGCLWFDRISYEGARLALAGGVRYLTHVYPMSSHLPTLMIPAAPLSVAGVTSYIQELLEQDTVLCQVWVVGEVSSANRYRGGLFFTLQDPDAKAAISCVIWNSYLERLVILPTQGEQFVILGRIHVHQQRGQYQLIVWQVLPAGEGLRALRYRQLRERLEAEGLFAPERKRSLPLYPTSVGIVTSPQAAAWGDIQRTLRRRYPGLRVLLSPALVQGEQAPGSIVRAIQRIERDGRASVLILSRGGGAVEDLACFNDERVVRAIANCSIPVIAGIGHQRDETLADLVADVCAHTPTAAAEMAVPRLADLVAAHRGRKQQLCNTLEATLGVNWARLRQLRQQLYRMRLEQRLHQEQQRLTWLKQRLQHSTHTQQQQAMQQCQLLRQKLNTLDPQAILRRGYALVQNQQGAIARSVDTLQPGQSLKVSLGKGCFLAIVTEVLDT